MAPSRPRRGRPGPIAAPAPARGASDPRRRLLAWIAAGLALLAVLTLAVRYRSSTAQPLPHGVLRGWNVLLVSIDTLRIDRVGAYGSTRGLTPTVDGLARGGLRFDTTYATVPLTLPSHTSLMTGLHSGKATVGVDRRRGAQCGHGNG